MNKIIKVSPQLNGVLHVAFQDGRCGEFDGKPFMASPFFAALSDESYLQEVALSFAGVGWPDGQDLGSDTVAAGLKVAELV